MLIMEHLEKVLLALIVIVSSLLVWTVYDSATSEKITLDKSEWSCKTEKSEVRLQPTGKVLVPITENHCTQYVKREY